MTKGDLRRRVRARELLAGTFVKTPHASLVEVLGSSALDFVVLDAEHGPYGIGALDACLLGARAAGLPALVRVAEQTASGLLQPLDMGAQGLVLPHATDPERVKQSLSMMRYMGGSRGFSNSPRAGGYGIVSMKKHIEDSDASVVRIFQIEDAEAIARVDDLAALDDVDCFLIGRADLALSMGQTDVNHDSVTEAVKHVCQRCKAVDKAVGIFLADAKEAAVWKELGASLFVLGSDQSMVRAQANAQAQWVHQLRAS